MTVNQLKLVVIFSSIFTMLSCADAVEYHQRTSEKEASSEFHLAEMSEEEFDELLDPEMSAAIDPSFALIDVYDASTIPCPSFLDDDGTSTGLNLDTGTGIALASRAGKIVDAWRSWTESEWGQYAAKYFHEMTGFGGDKANWWQISPNSVKGKVNRGVREVGSRRADDIVAAARNKSEAIKNIDSAAARKDSMAHDLLTRHSQEIQHWLDAVDSAEPEAGTRRAALKVWQALNVKVAETLGREAAELRKAKNWSCLK